MLVAVAADISKVLAINPTQSARQKSKIKTILAKGLETALMS